MARDMLGRGLWRRSGDGTVTGGIIVEAEAYLGPADPASHAYRRTPRSEIMYGSPGIAYVYFTYGVHWCANAVCETDGRAGAVLLRAIEPLEGLDRMAERRGTIALDGEGMIIGTALCSGPAKLTQAMGIDGSLNGADLQGPELWVTRGRGPLSDEEISATPRIGVTQAADRLARFIVTGSEFLSRSSA